MAFQQQLTPTTTLFSPDRFRQSRDDRREIIFCVLRNLAKSEIKDSLKRKTENRARTNRANAKMKSQNARADRGESTDALCAAFEARPGSAARFAYQGLLE
jgi:hypothetical protein